MAEGGDEGAINHPLGDEGGPVVGGVEVGRHLLETGQAIEQRLVQGVCCQAEQAGVEAMGAAGKTEMAQAGAGAPTAGLGWVAAGLEPELLGQVPVAAADGGLVHGQAATGADLVAADLEQVEHLEVLEDRRRQVGLAWPAGPPRRLRGRGAR